MVCSHGYVCTLIYIASYIKHQDKDVPFKKGACRETLQSEFLAWNIIATNSKFIDVWVCVAIATIIIVY